MPAQALVVGRKPPGPGQKTKLDFAADVHWVPADRIAEAGPDWGGNQRHFESLRQAIEFVMQGLTIADRANVWIATEDGNSHGRADRTASVDRPGFLFRAADQLDGTSAVIGSADTRLSR